MNRLFLTIIILSLLLSCNSKPAKTLNKPKADIENCFELIDYFENNKNNFNSDSFDIEGMSSEGTLVLVYHQAKTDWIVLQANIFGEMGKREFCYFLNKKTEPLITKVTDFRYSKPFHEADFATDSTINFIRYKPGIKVYDSKRKLLNDSDQINKLKTNAEEVLIEVFQRIEINK